MSTPATRHITTESEQMRARLDAVNQANEALKALIDMQFLRIYRYPLATLSMGTLAERQAQLVLRAFSGSGAWPAGGGK